MTTPKPIISIFVHCFPPAKGGVEYLVGEIKKVLDKEYVVHVFTGQGLTLDSYKTFSEFINDHQKTIHRLNLHRQTQRFANKFLHRFVTKFGIFSPFFFGPILQYDPEDQKIIEKSDIIMGFGMPTKSIYDAYLFAKKYQKPLIVLPAYHNVPYYNHCPSFQQVFNYAKKIIFLTHFEKNELLKNYSINPSKLIQLTFCPYTKKQIEDQQKRNHSKKLNSKNPVLGFVGQINPRKNLFIFKPLLDAGYQVLFAGAKTASSPEIEKYFEAYIKTNKLKIIYDFPEFDKANIYSQIDVFINPSVEESLGIVNFEAIFYGIPTIVDKNSAFAEFIPKDSVDVNNKKLLLWQILKNLEKSNNNFKLLNRYNQTNYSIELLNLINKALLTLNFTKIH